MTPQLPWERDRDEWGIEITATTPLGSAVLERLAAHDLQLAEAGPRGSGYWALATV